MKVTKIVDDDGKLTGDVSVRIPRGPEVYDAATGTLESEEILTEDEYGDQSKPVDPTKRPTLLRSDDEDAKKK